MNKKKQTNKKTTGGEICCECGKSVKLGSGKAVNRVPSFSNYKERKESGMLYPEGAYICEECDKAAYEEAERDEPIATINLCWADVEPTLKERGRALKDLTAEQRADIARFTQNGVDAYMDGWQDIIDEAVRQALK